VTTPNATEVSVKTEPGTPPTSGTAGLSLSSGRPGRQVVKGETIPGSRRVPLDKIGNEMRSTNLPKSAEIVVYCGGPKCPPSRMAADKLLKLGYENLRAYEGGLEEWKDAGLAIDKV